MDAPGSRILLRPGGLGRGGRLRHGVPGHGRLPGSGPLDDPGLVPISGPESRSRTPAASGSSWSGFSPLALGTVLAIGFAARMTDPVRHAAARLVGQASLGSRPYRRLSARVSRAV